MKQTILVFAIIMTMAGCATVGHETDPNAVSKIKMGETTKQQVFDLLGTPDRIMNVGNEVYWHYTHVRIMLGTMEHQSVMIVFGSDNIVKNVIENRKATDSNLGVNTGPKQDMPDVEENKRPK